MTERILTMAISHSRMNLARQAANSLSCPDVTLGGRTVSQRMIGIGPDGKPLCAAVNSCPTNMVQQGSNPDGTPMCVALATNTCSNTEEFVGVKNDGTVECRARAVVAKPQCASNQILKGIKPDGSLDCQDRAYIPCPTWAENKGIDQYGNPICQARPLRGCPTGQVQTGIDQQGNVMCNSLGNGCFWTSDDCPVGYIAQSARSTCTATNCAKKNGCQTTCTPSVNCCKVN